MNRLEIIIIIINWKSSCERYYLPTKETKNYNVITDGQIFFYQTVRNDLIIYDSIQKLTTGQGGDYRNACLLDYNYFKNSYKMIAIDSSKQQAPDADPKAVKQMNFTENLAQQATIFFIIEEVN